MNYEEMIKAAFAQVDKKQAEYGAMERSFVVAAELSSLKLNLSISPYMVVTIMESVKDARLAHDPSHVDSHVDGVNYRAMRGIFAPKPVPEAKGRPVEGPHSMNPVDALEAGIAEIAAKFSPKKGA